MVEWQFGIYWYPFLELVLQIVSDVELCGWLASSAWPWQIFLSLHPVQARSHPFLLIQIYYSYSTIVYANNGSVGAAYISIITLFIYNGFFNIGCNPLPYSYTTEILPYSVRSKGLAIYSVACWAFGVATQYANPVARKLMYLRKKRYVANRHWIVAVIGWKYYVIYLVLNAFYVSSPISLPFRASSNLI